MLFLCAFVSVCEHNEDLAVVSVCSVYMFDWQVGCLLSVIVFMRMPVFVFVQIFLKLRVWQAAFFGVICAGTSKARRDWECSNCVAFYMFMQVYLENGNLFSLLIVSV